jgi:hypothetical protein
MWLKHELILHSTFSVLVSDNNNHGLYTHITHGLKLDYQYPSKNGGGGEWYFADNIGGRMTGS